jgi:hypothetical protein
MQRRIGIVLYRSSCRKRELWKQFSIRFYYLRSPFLLQVAAGRHNDISRDSRRPCLESLTCAPLPNLNVSRTPRLRFVWQYHLPRIAPPTKRLSFKIEAAFVQDG